MYSWSEKKFEMKDIVGKTFSKVEKVNDDEIRFTADNGDLYALYHYQDCCESVVVKDIVGDLDDLAGSPLLEAEEVYKTGIGDGLPHEEGDTWGGYGTHTWTFYKFGTIKGHVNISWHGESNGYYSESVDKVFIPADVQELS